MRFNPKVGIAIGFAGVSALGPRALIADFRTDMAGHFAAVMEAHGLKMVTA